MPVQSATVITATHTTTTPITALAVIAKNPASLCDCCDAVYLPSSEVYKMMHRPLQPDDLTKLVATVNRYGLSETIVRMSAYLRTVGVPGPLIRSVCALLDHEMNRRIDTGSKDASVPSTEVQLDWMTQTAKWRNR